MVVMIVILVFMVRAALFLCQALLSVCDRMYPYINYNGRYLYIASLQGYQSNTTAGLSHSLYSGSERNHTSFGSMFYMKAIFVLKFLHVLLIKHCTLMLLVLVYVYLCVCTRMCVYMSV